MNLLFQGQCPRATKQTQGVPGGAALRVGHAQGVTLGLRNGGGPFLRGAGPLVPLT